MRRADSELVELTQQDHITLNDSTFCYLLVGNS